MEELFLAIILGAAFYQQPVECTLAVGAVGLVWGALSLSEWVEKLPEPPPRPSPPLRVKSFADALRLAAGVAFVLGLSAAAGVWHHHYLSQPQHLASAPSPADF